MSLTISRAEGVTMYTIHSNSRSKWPLICQLLGTMCYSPVCSVSTRLKQQLGCTFTVLATIQIMVGIINLGYGALTPLNYSRYIMESAPFWLGGMFIAVGIMCILAQRFPSQCLVVLTVMMNIVSSALAITAIVLYSVHLGENNYWNMCNVPERQNNYRYYWTTASPSKRTEWDAVYELKLKDYTACLENWNISITIFKSLDVMMIVLGVLQLCVTISWCVLNIKALCKKKADGQEVEDPELCKPLMEQETPNPVC
ncbi:hypothetical protein C0J45_18059 [Silurus meridionalis]|nr:hypothetical protein C0J45_18059 [Silurus meridionalis]